MASIDDPLDEPAYQQPADSRPPVFFHGYNGMKVRMNRMADGLYLSSIYWTLGPGPKEHASAAISDPPASGWARVLALPTEDPTAPLPVLCMWSFRSFRLPVGCHERRSMHGELFIETDAEKAQWLRGHLRQRWAELARATERSGEPDWALAKRAMELLGIEPPSEAEIDAMPRARPAPTAKERPQPKTQPAAAFKPVKRTGRKGEVLQAILDGKTSIDALTSQFGISRSNLLSQLFLLRKDHGIGYTIGGDSVSLQVPEGVEVFA